MKTNTITAGAVLRLTQESDIALLPAIERSAAQAFRQIPSLAWLADSEVISVARHHDYLETEPDSANGRERGRVSWAAEGRANGKVPQ